jgi:hypothetical protein
MAANAGSPNPAQPERGGADLPIHPLVKKLLGDAKGPQPDPLVTLVGYIGPSSKADSVRVYTGLDFQAYYEVPRAAVAATEAVDRQDENSPTRVLVKADTPVDVVQVSKQAGPASYFAGSIAGGYLADATAAQLSVGNLPIRLTHYTVCQICHLTALSICFCPTQHGPICPGIPGGGGGEEAAAQPFRYRSVNYTCPCIATHYPLCHAPEMQVGGGAAPAYQNSPSLFCPSWNIPCHSFWGVCPSHFPCLLPRAEAAAVSLECPTRPVICYSKVILCWYTNPDAPRTPC